MRRDDRRRGRQEKRRDDLLEERERGCSRRQTTEGEARKDAEGKKGNGNAVKTGGRCMQSASASSLSLISNSGEGLLLKILDRDDSLQSLVSLGSASTCLSRNRKR